MFESFTGECHIEGCSLLFDIRGRHFIDELSQPTPRRRAIGDAQQHVCRAGKVSVSADDQALNVLILKFRQLSLPYQKRQSHSRIAVSSRDENRALRMVLLLSMVLAVKSG